jgi:Ala-tRNA(Pro) deacylase
MDCRERVQQYLQDENVNYEMFTHPEVYTIQELAATLHVPGRQVAKVVMVKADQKLVMVVVPAPYRVNLERIQTHLGSNVVELAKESDFSSLFPDCLPGAMPPLGNLYRMTVYVDEVLAAQTHVVFRVGTHRHSIKIPYADLSRLVQPVVGQFAWQF